MKKAIVILTVISLLLLSGCSDYHEINRGYLVTAVGIEKKNDTSKIFVEAMSSTDTADKTMERVVLSAAGNSPQEAYANLDASLTKPLYFKQLGTIILSENISAEAQPDIIDFFEKIDWLSLGVYVVNTSDVEALFDTRSPDGVLGYDIIGLINNYKRQTGNDISNQIYHLNRDGQALPIIDVADGQLNLTIVGDKK